MRSDGRTVGQSGALRKRLALAGAVVLLSFSPTVRLSAQAVDRTKPPTLPPPPALKLPAVQVDTLPNGLTVAVVEMHKVPLVDVQVLVDAGAARDPADLAGLATFTATMLQQGAGRRGALEIADEVAFLGGQLGTAASYDAATVTLHVPKRRLSRALDLLADVVLGDCVRALSSIRTSPQRHRRLDQRSHAGSRRGILRGELQGEWRPHSGGG